METKEFAKKLIRDPGTRYAIITAGMLASFAAGIGFDSIVKSHESRFALCNAPEYVSQAGNNIAWAEETADSIACFISSKGRNVGKNAPEVTFKDGHEIIKVTRPVKSQIKGTSSAGQHLKGTGEGEYKLTADITGGPYGEETVQSINIEVDGGIKQLDPIYLLAIFREHKGWSFTQEIVQENGMLAPVDSGSPDAQASYSEISNLAAQIACQEERGKAANWVLPDDIGSKQIFSDCSTG